MSLTDELLAELRQGIDQRYGPGIFQYHGRGSAKIFRFGIFRLCASVTHWITGATRFRRISAGKNLPLGLYTTRNQRIALDGLKHHVRPELCNHCLYDLHPALALKMVALLLVALVIYPFAFPFARNRYSLHEHLLLRPRLKTLLVTLNRLTPESVTVSNDHQGEVYWLSFAYAYLGKRVHYVQHGMVTADFPKNYFSTCYLRDAGTAELYARQLCHRSDAQIVVVPEFADEVGSSPVSSVPFVLVALSHRYHWRETRKLMRLLSEILPAETEVRLRFHPSDRFARPKFALATFGLERVRPDRSERPFLSVFREATLTISALSSVLPEAAAAKDGTIIWLQSLGVPYDYYQLSGKIPVSENTEALACFLKGEGARLLCPQTASNRPQMDGGNRG